jgi:hypothetical protein
MALGFNPLSSLASRVHRGSVKRARVLLLEGFETPHVCCCGLEKRKANPMSIFTKTHCIHLLSSLGLLVACSGDGADASVTTDPDIEQRAATLAQNLIPSDVASVSGEPAYLELRRDLRRCAAPLCGGFFVSRVNRLTTVCADGSRSDECYVSELDFLALGLSDDQVASVEAAPEDFVLRGDIEALNSEVDEIGRLIVTEAWQGHAGVEARGAFLRVQNEGIVCITSPCLSFSAELLNSSLPEVRIAEIDLQGISADPSDAFEQLNAPDGLLVAALPVIVSGPAGRALGLDASEYFTPLSAESPSSGPACGSRGLGECAEGSFCSFPDRADCGRADAPGTCAPQPEFCTFEFAPVCGCDGQTYANACTAASAGVSVEFAGECEAASD